MGQRISHVDGEPHLADALAEGRFADAARLWLTSGARGVRHAATAANQALTSWTGVLLIPLLGLVGLTGVAFGHFWRAHLIIGLALIPILGLKLVTTTYRAVRYYTRSRRYREAGPPEWPARILAPPLVVATVVAMVSGIVMWAANNQDRPWSTIHTDSVVIMGGLVGLHLLFYLPRAGWVVWRDVRQRGRAALAGRLRAAMVVAVLCGGIVLGFALQSSTPFPVHSERESAASQ